MTQSNIWLPNIKPGSYPPKVKQQLHQQQTPAQTTNLPSVNIHVGNVSGNSGIYIGGTLTVFGLSSHSKTNSGFGSIGDSNTFYRCVSVVYDPDLVDTPIDDRDIHILQQAPPQGATNIGVQSVWVNTLQQNAGTFIGSTNVTGMDSHQKQNLGSGQVFGNHNVNCASVNMTNDQDYIDGNMLDNDNKAGVFFNG